MASQLNSEPMVKAMAALREQFSPTPDNPRGTDETCVDCGRVFRRWKGRKRHRCPTCAAIVGATAGASMANRAGPTYERAVRGQFAFWSAEMARLGLITDQPE